MPDAGLRRTAELAPAPTPAGRGERGVRVAVAIAVAALLGLALWPALAVQAAAPPPPVAWPNLAPPPETRMPPWRWIALRAGGAAHLRLAPAPGDPARPEALPAWRLQQALPGHPELAVVVAVAGRLDDPATETRAAETLAALLRGIPTLAPSRIVAVPRTAPPGLDLERLRFRVREHLAR